MKTTLIAALVAATTSVLPASAAAQPPATHWSAAWTAAMQRPSADNSNWSTAGFDHQTIRQSIRLSTGGRSLRIRLSNQYGAKPLHVTGMTLTRATGGPHDTVTFDDSRRTTVATGRTMTSDPVTIATDAGDHLVISLYVDGATGPATYHEDGLTTTTAAPGDHLYDGVVGSEASHSVYYVTGVDVTGAAGTVVTFGDSITNGHNSTVDADRRYSDALAERLQSSRLGVANVGITGNLLLSELPCFGASGVSRFDRDALGQPGVRTVIVEEGENDIWDSEGNFGGCGVTARVTADQLIAGYRSMIKAAHSRGVRIVGATMTPFKADYMQPADFARAEAIRDRVNTWIRTSGQYDAVADFARAVGDPSDEQQLNPAYDSGDHLHPNDAGYEALAVVASEALSGRNQR
ncbi:SGNH/GDSL hydrolase family protein [Kribbella sp. NPDC050241]|uniref:SGNH/GDSL hydrolase family protein n=1 Tax=Kribbella sp. NPDC050241 TaxID=3364115 RepID=UPI0037B37EB5